MNPEKLNKLTKLLRSQARRNAWLRVVCMMGVVVLLGVTYALMLPAVTMSNDPVCGIVAHTHGEQCYEDSEEGEPLLICNLAEHVHDERCLPAALTEPVTVRYCGWDYEHQHSEGCFVDGYQVCTLSEHRHTDVCLDPEAEQPQPTQPPAEQPTEPTEPDEQTEPNEQTEPTEPSDPTDPTDVAIGEEVGEAGEFDPSENPGENGETSENGELSPEENEDPGDIPPKAAMYYDLRQVYPSAQILFEISVNGVVLDPSCFPDGFYGNGVFTFRISNVMLLPSLYEAYYVDLDEHMHGFQLFGRENRPLENYTEEDPLIDDSTSGVTLYYWAVRNSEGVYRIYFKGTGKVILSMAMSGGASGKQALPEIAAYKTSEWDASALAYRYTFDLEIPAYYNYYGQSYIIKDQVSICDKEGRLIKEGHSPLNADTWASDINLTYQIGSGEEHPLLSIDAAKDDPSLQLAWYRTASGLVLMNRKNHSGACKVTSPTQEYGGWCACWQAKEPVHIKGAYTDRYAQTYFLEYPESNFRNTVTVEDISNGASHGIVGEDGKVKGNYAMHSVSNSIPTSIPKMLAKEFDPKSSMCTAIINDGMADLSEMDRFRIEDIMTNAELDGSPEVTRIHMEGESEVSELLTEGTDYELSIIPTEQNPETGKYTAGFTITPKVFGCYKYVIRYAVRKLGDGDSGNSIGINGTYLNMSVSMTFVIDLSSLVGEHDVNLMKQYEGGNPSCGSSFGIYNSEGKLLAISYVRKVEGSDGDMERVMARIFSFPGMDPIETVLGQTPYEPGGEEDRIHFDYRVGFLPGALYYIQEIEAPEGYLLDTTKYYFFVTSYPNDPEPAPIISEVDGKPIPVLDDWKVKEENGVYFWYLTYTFETPVTNYILYTLPETGGNGTLTYMLWGGLLVALPCLHWLRARRKRQCDALLVSREPGGDDAPYTGWWGRRLMLLPDAYLLYNRYRGLDGDYPKRE